MGLQGLKFKPMSLGPRRTFSPVVQGQYLANFGGYLDFAGVEREFRQAELADIEKGLQEYLSGGNEELQIELGVALELSGKSDAALQELTAAEQQLPDNALAPYALARLLMEANPAAAEKTNKQEGRWSIIVSHLRETIKFDPDNIPAHYHLGNAIRKLVEEESYVDAVEVYTKYLAKDAPLGYQEEVQHFINEQDPDKQREAAFLAGKAALDARNYEKSIEHFSKATDLGNNEAYYYLGEAYEKTKDYANAVDAYRQATGGDSNRKDAYFAFGRATIKLFTNNKILQEGLMALTFAERELPKEEVKGVDRLHRLGVEISNLLKSSLSSPQDQELIFENEHWYAKYGAFHGWSIPQDEQGLPQEALIPVYQRENGRLLGSARLTKVGIFASQLELLDDLEEKLVALRKEDNLPDNKYPVALLPPEYFPYIVDFSGDPSAIQLLTSKWSEKLNERDDDLNTLNIVIPRNALEQKKAQSRIVVDEKGYQIWNVTEDYPWMDEPLMLSQYQDDLAIVERIKTNLQKIARWSRLMALNSKNAIGDKGFKLELFTMDYTQWRAAGEIDTWNNDEFFANAACSEERTIRLSVPKASFITAENSVEMNREVEKDSVLIGIRVKSFEDDLHYYLYDFKKDATIDSFPNFSLTEKTTETGVVLIPPVPLFLEDNEMESTVRLKLLVTKQPLPDNGLLTQDGVNPVRSIDSPADITSTIDGWYLQTIELTLARQQ